MQKMITNSQGGEEYPTNNKKRKANGIGHILCMNCFLKPRQDAGNWQEALDHTLGKGSGPVTWQTTEQMDTGS